MMIINILISFIIEMLILVTVYDAQERLVWGKNETAQVYVVQYNFIPDWIFRKVTNNVSLC